MIFEASLSVTSNDKLGAFMNSVPPRKRSAGRDARRAARQQRPTSTATHIDRKIPYLEILSEEALQLIEHN
ncbi:MAG: hypothetical protein HQ492_03460, partial [Woeseiaceae bacterium]|nr:hypothetical protein [Woeseiaceae bacterium]